MCTSGGIYTAINDLKTSVSEGKSLIASAITDKGVSTASSATFQTMASNIGKIIVCAISSSEIINTTTIFSNNTLVTGLKYNKSYVNTIFYYLGFAGRTTISLTYNGFTSGWNIMIINCSTGYVTYVNSNNYTSYESAPSFTIPTSERNNNPHILQFLNNTGSGVAMPDINTITVS